RHRVLSKKSGWPQAQAKDSMAPRVYTRGRMLLPGGRTSTLAPFPMHRNGATVVPWNRAPGGAVAPLPREKMHEPLASHHVGGDLDRGDPRHPAARARAAAIARGG